MSSLSFLNCASHIFAFIVAISLGTKRAEAADFSVQRRNDTSLPWEGKEPTAPASAHCESAYLHNDLTVFIIERARLPF